MSFAKFAGVFEGGFGKSACQVWCFCGEVVVKCVANVDSGTGVSRRLKVGH
jgi:hypothetical protein